MYYLVGLSVTEVCLCVFKVKYNSYHVQGVFRDLEWGSWFPVLFYSDTYTLMHSCTVRNWNVKLLSTS